MRRDESRSTQSAGMPEEDDSWKACIVFMIASQSALNFVDWGEDEPAPNAASADAASPVGRATRAS